MKKIATVVMVFLCTILLCGCSAYKNTSEEFDLENGIVLLMQFGVNGDIDADDVKKLENFLDGETQDSSDVRYDVGIGTGIVEISLGFENFGELGDFYGLTQDSLPVTCEIKRGAFFAGRTYTFDNPWDAVLKSDSTKHSGITTKVENLFDVKADSYKFIYVFVSKNRRTDTNATKSVNNLGSYNYYFLVPDAGDEPVQIFDRLANSPLWYVIAVALTGAFMAGVYFTCKRTVGK